MTQITTPEPGHRADKDSLADMAAVELLHTLETPINGIPSVRMIHYENARRLVKAALLAIHEHANAVSDMELLAEVRELLRRNVPIPAPIAERVANVITNAEGAA